jgi:hypothetical protein
MKEGCGLEKVSSFFRALMQMESTLQFRDHSWEEVMESFLSVFSGLFPFDSTWFEVRLSPSPICRAWTERQGCMSAVEWNAELARLPVFRAWVELARLRISEVLAVQGVDPMGIVRKILIHESTARLSRGWLREVGFVHLEVASGIHLYCLWNGFEAMFKRISVSRFESLRMIQLLRGGVPLVLWFGFWALSGFRPGLIRPLVLALFRWGAVRQGMKWWRGASLSAALAVDALLGFFLSYGSTREFSEWAPGELHYALSWWGGILGYEWARANRYGSLRSHLALSVFSWLTVLPVDLWSGRVALLTPLLSFLSVEAFVRGGFLFFTLSAFGIVCGGMGWWASAWVPVAKTALQWGSWAWNRGMGWVAENLSQWGGVRELTPEEGRLLAGVWCLALLTIYGFFSAKRQESLSSFTDFAEKQGGKGKGVGQS